MMPEEINLPGPGKHRESLQEAFVRRIEWAPRKVSASFILDGEEYPMWLEASEDLFQETDFLLPLTLLQAMSVGAPLELPGKISPRLLHSTRQIQDMYRMWDALFRRVPVKAEAREPSTERAPGVGCLFSGGVDAFYTLRKHQDEVSHLIFIDPPGGDRSIIQSVSRMVDAVGEEIGKSVIKVNTNLPSFTTDTGISWFYFNGPWIAGTALLFQHLLGKVLVSGSSTSSYDSISPQGTHPILDPLWSTELTEVHHIGCEAWRVEKAAYIADYPVAMKYLQVCPGLRRGYNCGECEKCLRTMINLKIAGVLERCETLPKEIDPRAVAQMDLSGYYPSLAARENLRALEGLGTEPELSRALEEAIDKGRQMILRSGYSEKRLNRMHRLLKASEQRGRALQEKNERLIQQNTRLQGQLKTSRQKGRALKQRNERLIQRNSGLEASRSSRRYRLADSIVERINRIPGLRRLLSR